MSNGKFTVSQTNSKIINMDSVSETPMFNCNKTLFIEYILSDINNLISPSKGYDLRIVILPEICGIKNDVHNLYCKNPLCTTVITNISAVNIMYEIGFNLGLSVAQQINKKPDTTCIMGNTGLAQEYHILNRYKLGWLKETNYVFYPVYNSTVDVYSSSVYDSDNVQLIIQPVFNGTRTYYVSYTTNYTAPYNSYLNISYGIIIYYDDVVKSQNFTKTFELETVAYKFHYYQLFSVVDITKSSVKLYYAICNRYPIIIHNVDTKLVTVQNTNCLKTTFSIDYCSIYNYILERDEIIQFYSDCNNTMAIVIDKTLDIYKSVNVRKIYVTYSSSNSVSKSSSNSAKITSTRTISSSSSQVNTISRTNPLSKTRTFSRTRTRSRSRTMSRTRTVAKI
jgi:hypothetical protein